MKPILPAILWAGMIFFFSTSSGIQMPASIIAPDKIGHLVVYGVLNWLVIWALRKQKQLSHKSALWATLFVTSYGIALEFVQWAFFPNRFFEVWDMVANFAGAVLVFIFTFYFTKT